MADTLEFEYTVRDSSGGTKTGTMYGTSSAAVADKLKGNGYTPLSINEKKVELGSREINILPASVGLKDLAVFSRQFATMINSGLSMIRALNILTDQSDNRRMKEILSTIRTDVEQGKSLSASMGKFEDFPPLFVAMVKAGETGGLLDQTLLRVADTFESELELRRKVKSAMTYPVIVLIMAVGLSTGMIIFIVPVFEGLFTDLGGELPLPTQILVTLSVGMRKFWYLFIGIPLALFYAFKYAKKQPTFREGYDRFTLKIPVFGPLFHKVAVARFCRNLGSLMRAGVPILQCLEIAADTVNNAVMSSAIRDVGKSVSEGTNLAGPMAKHDIFPTMAVQMIAVGEETGAVDDMLHKVADFYDSEVNALTEQLTAAIEPLMIAILGGLVGGMVIALYMPMFKIFDLVK